jgi:hypothetical protein
MVLPADASILEFSIIGVASNAATSATISVGSSTSANSTEFVNGQDVKTAGGLMKPTGYCSALLSRSWKTIPLGQDIQIFAKYAETGTVSTPWWSLHCSGLFRSVKQ